MIKALAGRHLTSYRPTHTFVLTQETFSGTNDTHKCMRRMIRQMLFLHYSAFVCVGGAYNFNQLGNGDLELHSDWIRDILHGSDELVVLSEESPEESVLRLGGKAA